ncbi:endo-1,4-beta-xylanase [Spirosoma radiotolerans]|nr:endo-1,4-beta-xylanase [Spirosoma radiotolerans]
MSTNQLANMVVDSNSTLRSVASFPIGAAPNYHLLVNSSKVYNLFSNQFNSVTAHAYMNIEYAPSKFNFSEADYWTNYTNNKQIRMHGHCLLYHMATPDWLSNYSGSTNDFEKVIKNHIQTIVSRYKGKFKSWDVTNEIITGNGTLRNTSFRKLYKNDEDYMNFIKKCFVWAHESDPNALLFYNDFDYEVSAAKIDAVVKMINDFKKSGIPIHGLGTQMHISIKTPESGIANSLRKLADTGLQIHISELDIKVNVQNETNFTCTNALQNEQSLKFYNLVKLYKSNVPSYLQYGITMWDLSDADSWLVTAQKPEMPTLFDKEYNKKSSFYGILNALKQ